MRRSRKSNLTTRRHLIKAGGALALGTAVSWPAAGRGVLAAQGTPFVPGVTPGSPEHAGGWTTKLPAVPSGMPFDPAITISSNRSADSTIEFYKGDTIENNPFTRMVRESLGIDWRAAWTWATNEDATTKLNTAIASGDLPDMMETVPLNIYQSMLEADLLEDITDVWEREASPEFVKKPLEYGGAGRAWSYAEVDGRKMGIPYSEVAAQNDKLMWIRQDWLDQVGMEVPTTIDELSAVATAFVEAELGQDGTTIGLVANGALNSWYGSLDPVFGAFGVVPFGSGSFWTPEGDGLMFDGVRPQMKEALALVQEWYQNGIISTDFFTLEPGDCDTPIAGNQAGLYFAPSFAAGWSVAASTANDPEARWIFADIPAGPDGRKGKAWSDPYPQTLFAFRKGFAHVDAVIRQVNWMAELTQVPENRFHGWEGYNYAWDGDTITTDGLSTAPHKWFYGPIGTTGGSGTDPLREVRKNEWLESLRSTPADQLDAMQRFLLEDPTGFQTLQRQAYTTAVERSEADGIKNQFTTVPTATMVSRGATLADLEESTMLGIIKGDLPIDEFDNFVSQWKDLGGDSITEEVNEWWSARA